MGEEVKLQVGEGRPVRQAELTPTESPREASPSSPQPAKAVTNVVGATRPTAAAASVAPAVRDEQIEKGPAGDKQSRVANGQKDIEFGAVVAVFSFAVMLAGFFLNPVAAKGPAENWRLDILMLLAFASFICGFSFMLLSMQLLGTLPEIHVSCHWVMSRCLFYACIVLSTLTLLGLLVVMPFKPYVYAGLAILAAVAMPVAVVHCYASRRAEGAPDAAAEFKEQTEEMEASFKITGAMATSSFAGLVGVLFGVYKHSEGAGAGSTPGAVHVAIMFMFITAVVSVLLMMLSMKVLEIRNQKLRRSIVGFIRHVNAVLLFSLAIAALSAAFLVLSCYVLAAFVSLAVAAIVYFIIEHCTTAQGAADGGPQGDDGNTNSSQETQLKWMADIASKATMSSLGGIMAIFGSFLGDADKNQVKAVEIKICMFFLTSAFASGHGLTLLTIWSGGSAPRVGFKAATNVLAWSAMGLLAAAVLAIYGVEVMKS